MSGVSVKPLVWQHVGPYLWSAEFLNAKWSVTKSQSDNPGQYFVSYCGIDIGLCDSLEAAKAAAQADYEARILAALEPPSVRTCAKCGAPEDNHPYRHMFVPNVDGSKP